MKKLILFVTFLFLSLYIAAQEITNDNNLLLVDGYVYGNIIEKPELERNNIYKREGVLSFSYKFFDKNGKELFFYVNKDGSWDFIDVNTTKKNLVKGFQLEISKENMNFNDPVFYQTGILYRYTDNKVNDDMTGLIENFKNLWFHPPREYLFQILELNPYPYIKYPLELGHSWNWKLKISEGWGDKRWKQWKGIVELKYKYCIVGKKLIKTTFGNLDCFIIESEATSVLGKTKLTSYFNTSFGFVRFDYTNIDNSKLEIILQSAMFPMLKIF